MRTLAEEETSPSCERAVLIINCEKEPSKPVLGLRAIGSRRNHPLSGLGEKKGGLMFGRTDERPVLTGRDMRWTISLDGVVNQYGRSHWKSVSKSCPCPQESVYQNVRIAE
jgi:hypothetical protein